MFHLSLQNNSKRRDFEVKDDPKDDKPQIFFIGEDHKVQQLDSLTGAKDRMIQAQTLTGSRSLEERIQSMQTKREEIFKNRNPWTISVEEAAELEMRSMVQSEYDTSECFVC